MFTMVAGDRALVLQPSTHRRPFLRSIICPLGIGSRIRGIPSP